MSSLALVVGTLAILVPFSAGSVASADESDSALKGEWSAESGVVAGEPFPDEVLKTIKLTIKDGEYTVWVGEAEDRGTVRTDAKAQPAQMTLVGSEGPNKGKTILAIYRVEGEKVTICYDLSGKSHPAEFQSTAENKLFLATYRRVK